MNRLNLSKKWLAAFALGTATISSVVFPTNAFAQTPFEKFLERAESQQFNTNILAPAQGAPASVQMMFGKPTTNIQLNSQALFNLSDFKIELPGLTNLHAVKEKIIANNIGGTNWVGDVVFLDPAGYASEKEGRAYFVETANGVSGTIHTKEEVIQIFPDGAGGQVMISSDPSAFDNEGEIIAADAPAGDAAGGPSIGGRIDGQSPASSNDPYTVDVLWVVTAKAVNDTNVDIPAAIELAMTHANDSYANSNINGRVRTVHVHYDTSYTEGSSMTTTLYDAQDPSDGLLDDVHNLRAQYGADMVAIVSGASNYCGQAFLDARPEWAFSVNYAGCMASYTPAHELGHNFGAHHDVANGTNNNYVFGYGIYNQTDDPKWRTVMSYQCPAGGCSRIPYFTTPEQTYNGASLGDPLEADNTRVHRVRMAEVAGYYASTASSCTEHTATNSQHVSEGRAYTETVYFTTTYYATGSGDNLGYYGFVNSTLAEESPGYFTEGVCPENPTSSETQFAPEVQNLNPIAGPNGLTIDGEVFDANADTITAVSARINGNTTWEIGTLANGTFSVLIPTASSSSTVTVDMRTEDNTGESFEFTTTFDVDLGVPPEIELSGTNFRDDTAVIYGRTIDPDNSVNELFYQVGGTGDPEVGTWTSFAVTSSYWTLIANVPTGTSTVFVYGVDESGLQSNVISTQVTTLPLEAPACDFLGASPSTSQVSGELDINGLVSDVNQSDVTLEFSVNGGSWTAFAAYEMITTRQPWTIKLPDTYSNGSVLNISVRANDSSGLTSSCGTDVYTVVYPTGDESPTCEIVDIERIEGSVVFHMFISDPNGDVQSIYGKESSQTEWVQFWPAVVSRNGLPVPGIGNFTIDGRVLDAQGNEGLCSANITIADTQFTPDVDYANGSWESEADSVILRARINDWDGDIVSAETRPVGGSSWSALAADDIWGNYSIDLGLIADGDYSYEVRATDAGGRVSDILVIDFNVERQLPPTLQNITWSQTGSTVTVSGDSIDPNNNMRRVYFELDGADAIYDNVTGSTWSHNFVGLSVGQHSVVIYAEDTWGMQSAPETVNFEVTAGSAPLFANINVSIVNDNTVRIDVSGTDADGDLETLYITRDNTVSLGYTNTGFDTWIIEYPNQSVGTHTLDIYLEDAQGNTSIVESRIYEIEAPTTACFESTNSEHETAGRATSVEECSFELFGNCYGTITTTWYAVGSNDPLGTSGSTVNSLLETSPGYYELGVCNDTTAPVITLAGNNPIDVYQGGTYVEPGFTATDNVDGDISASVGISGNVDTSIIGAYQLTYNVSDSSGNAATPVIRTVNVVADDVKPVITISGGTTYTVTLGNSFSNPPANATDNVDGNISANVVTTGTVDTNAVGTYHLYYNVSDAAGNAADEVVVTVTVQEEQDTTAPVITLSGDTVMTIDLNSSYSDPGYSAIDNNDGDITANVVVGGDVVDTSTEGTYVVTYNVSDAAGNAAVEQTRTVNVVDPNGGSCFTSTLDEHVTAGRAQILYTTSYYTVVTSGQPVYLGTTVLDGGTTVYLEEQSPGHFVKVTSCN